MKSIGSLVMNFNSTTTVEKQQHINRITAREEHDVKTKLHQSEGFLVIMSSQSG